jgi:DNA-binding NtrC family response regulator
MSNKTPRVLVVEDDPQLRNMLAQNFTYFGCEVMTAANGEEAMRVIETKSITAIVSDIQMPKMNGVQLLNHLRDKGITIPVIVMTGYSIYEEDHINDLGAMVTLQKPFTRAQLKEIVDGYIKLLVA